MQCNKEYVSFFLDFSLKQQQQQKIMSSLVPKLAAALWFVGRLSSGPESLNPCARQIGVLGMRRLPRGKTSTMATMRITRHCWFFKQEFVSTANLVPIWGQDQTTHLGLGLQWQRQWSAEWPGVTRKLCWVGVCQDSSEFSYEVFVLCALLPSHTHFWHWLPWPCGHAPRLIFGIVKAAAAPWHWCAIDFARKLRVEGIAYLGKVWMPSSELHLSAAAGEALRGRLRKRKQHGEGLEEAVKRVPLDELGGLLADRLSRGSPLKKAGFDVLKEAAENMKRVTALSSVLTLKDRPLPWRLSFFESVSLAVSTSFLMESAKDAR